MMHINGLTRLAGVVGDPIAHSRSPRLHNHWLGRYGINGVYVPLRVVRSGLCEALVGLRAAGFLGVNVTLPHKEAAYRLVDRRDSSAERSGAVNTIVFDGGTMIGSNTDGLGFIANLVAHGVTPAGERVLILGAGGTARAIAASLLDHGCSVTISNRDPNRAEALRGYLPQLRTVAWASRVAAVGHAQILVNTTSVGLQDPLASPVSLEAASPDLVVVDVIYSPPRTLLLKQASELGLRTLGGLGMLLHQARPGFRSWFGVDPVVDAALEAAVSDDISCLE